MPRFIWELNLTTILVFAAGALAFYIGVLRQRDELRDLKQKVGTTADAAMFAEAQKAIDQWKLQVLALRAEHDVFKEKVITEYVRKPELDKVVDRLFDKIEQQGKETIEAINGIYARMLDDAKDGRPKPRG